MFRTKGGGMVITRDVLWLQNIDSGLICLVFALLFWAAPLAAAEPIRICYENQSYAPFLLGEDVTPIEKPGILLELIELASKSIDLGVEFYRRPWKRCIADVKDGKGDALFAAIWKADREQWAVFPKSGELVDVSKGLWHVTYPIFVKRGTALSFNGEAFSGLQFGLSAPLGYVVNEKLTEMRALASGSYDIEHGFKLVSMGRMDGYVVETYIGRATLATLGLNDSITVLPEPFIRTDWYVPVSHRYYQSNRETAEAFWSALAQVRVQSANALMEKYSVSP